MHLFPFHSLNLVLIRFLCNSKFLCLFKSITNRHTGANFWLNIKSKTYLFLPNQTLGMITYRFTTFSYHTPIFQTVLLNFSQSTDANFSYNLNMEASYSCQISFSSRSNEKPYCYPLNVPNHQPKNSILTHIVIFFIFFLNAYSRPSSELTDSMSDLHGPSSSEKNPDPTFQHESMSMASAKPGP